MAPGGHPEFYMSLIYEHKKAQQKEFKMATVYWVHILSDFKKIIIWDAT